MTLPYRTSLWVVVGTFSTSFAFIPTTKPVHALSSGFCTVAHHHALKDSAPRAVSPLYAVGFGGGEGRTKSPGADDAKQALRSCGGDINRATTLVFNRRLSLLEEQNKELADKIKQLYAPGATKSDPGVQTADVHEALVAATWDAIAIMNTLPSRRTTAEERELKRIGKRLQEVADAARLPPAPRAVPSQSGSDGGGDGAQSKAAILDVGCGDGTLMPHLLDQAATKPRKQKAKKGKALAEDNADERTSGNVPENVPGSGSLASSPSANPRLEVTDSQVTGVDLSPVMIQAARRKYKSRWLVGNLFSLGSLLRKDGPEPMFTSAVFNGSLQFFLEPAKALAEASAWLVDGGHIVVSHVQGADFVEDECQRNARVAPSPIPLREGMEALAREAGLTLLEGRDDDSQRRFLLYVLRKD